MESCSYGELSEALHQKLVKGRVPLDGTVEVTHRCSLHCSHCYNGLPMGDTEAHRRELSREEHYLLLDQMAEAGCLWLLYTGGEIFARPDFLDIFTYAKQKGLLISLFTNGTLITPQIADHLARWTPFSIEITLYGKTRKTYERITGVPGSFEKCLRGIHLLKDKKLPLKIKTVVLTANKHELWEMKKFVQQDLGLEFRFDAMINPKIDGSLRPLSFRLSPEEIVELDLLDAARATEWKSFACQFNGPAHASADSDEMYHCGGGIGSFSIDPEGRMNLCAFSQSDGYDLRRGNFKDAWENHLLRARCKKATRMSKCVSCEIKAMCGMCPAMGELEQGDSELPVDFLCQVAHLRSYALDIPIAAHGECEYCAGGNAYGKMMSLAAHLRQNASDSLRKVI